MQLQSTLKVDLPALHLARIKVIDGHDFSKVKEKVRQDALKRGATVGEQELNAGILALKQYYALPVLDKDNAHAISSMVDDFWHAHLLFTEDYAAFCQQVCGGFMHHIPLLETSGQDRDHVERLYNYTLDVFETFFTLDQKMWPRLSDDPTLIVCRHQNDIHGTYNVPALLRKDQRYQAYAQ